MNPPEGKVTEIETKAAPIEETAKLPLNLCDCGLAGYRETLERQLALWERRYRGEIPNTVLIVEHHPVITLGARQSANRLLAGRQELARRGIDVVEIRRGGGTTAHNPGQLVFYPILHLQQLNLGISEYMRELEALGMELLGRLGVSAGRRRGLPGLWVGEKKIASVGVRVSKFVTRHGMAINIRNDLGIFDLLVPCGLENVRMTSVLNETGTNHEMGPVKRRLGGLLAGRFSKDSLTSYETCS